MENTDKKNKSKILKYIGWGISTIQLIISVVLIVYVAGMNILPTIYMIIGSVILVLLAAVVAVMMKWTIPGIIAKIISVIMCVIMIIGCIYIKATDNTINKITGIQTKIDNICIYIPADDDAKELLDIKDYNFGILSELDRANTDKVIDRITEEVKQDITITEYSDILYLVDGLLSKETGAIILNSAYVSFLEGVEGYSDFESKVKAISYQEIVTEIPADNDPKEPETKDPYAEYEGYLYGGEDVFTLYISGIDTTGSPAVNRNSDVNILMTVNTTTRQILMINTPRDFYMPLSISGGVKDKLTHAGCYGIDVSVNTLEMFYGVNIDDYLKVNFTGFQKIIDALGGVDVYSDYAFTAYNGDTFVEGYNYNLNGSKALAFARERHSFASGDRQRGKNQMAVIRAIINKMVSSDMLLNYTSVLEALSDSMVTSMSYEEITDLVKFQLSDMRGWDIISCSVDGTGDNLPCYSLSSPNYVMIPNQATVDKAKAYLEKIYSGEKITE